MTRYRKVLLSTALSTLAGIFIYLMVRRKRQTIENMNMKYFTIQELAKSNTASALDIDNTPTEDAVRNLQALVVNVLDPLREAYGGPLYVNSGYRCAELNKVVGGVSSSQHMKGEASDIDTRKGKTENERLATIAQRLGLPYDQLIIEDGGTWLHISHKRNGNNRREIKITHKM